MSKKTKVLDLDKFGGDAERTITILGKTYPVEEMTVENFIQTTKDAERLEADKEATYADQLVSTIAMIQRSVPSISAEELQKLSLTKMGVIVKFLNGDMDEELEKAAEAQAAEAGDEAKK